MIKVAKNNQTTRKNKSNSQRKRMHVSCIVVEHKAMIGYDSISFSRPAASWETLSSRPLVSLLLYHPYIHHSYKYTNFSPVLFYAYAWHAMQSSLG